MSDIKKEKVVIVGYGWVGQANALALDIMGYDVSYFDVGKPVPHYVPKYQSTYDHIKPIDNVLAFDSDNTWYIVCVGDRVSNDGVQDISLIHKALQGLEGTKGRVILRSTIIPKKLNKLNFDFYVPEFLHEKFAVEECINPFYFVVGVNNLHTPEPSFFTDWRERSHKYFVGSPEEAAFIKYLSNAWNAARITFVNEFGDLMGDPSDPKGVKDIERVIDFVLGKKMYLRYGKSYSGHCLPKDVRALVGSYKEEKNVNYLTGMHKSNLAHEKIDSDALPQWFSAWVSDQDIIKSPRKMLRAMWLRFNDLPFVRPVRRKLRFVKTLAERMTPKKSLEDTRKIWDDLALANARYYVNPSTGSGKAVTEFELRDSGQMDYNRFIKDDALVQSHVSLVNAPVIIHIGCGIGRMTEFFADDFIHVYAIDISPEMIAVAKKRLITQPNIKLVAGDGRTLPYHDNFADLVFSYQTFQHIPQADVIEDYFSEIGRTLKPGCIAKLHLRANKSVYRWNEYYGVSMLPDRATFLANKHGLRVLETQLDGTKNFWLTVEKR
ncbi:MAG TPA: class I SAM-dependent methyltransferase [Candidatus Paceibacterota bacterium]